MFSRRTLGLIATATAAASAVAASSLLYPAPSLSHSSTLNLYDAERIAQLPVVSDQRLVKAAAPKVPPPTGRTSPARVVVDLCSTVTTLKVTANRTYDAWTFDGNVPGPFIRARVGDVLEVRHRNADVNGIGHNIDFHAVVGPGGGAPALYAESEEVKSARFVLQYPGLFFYHCAAAPVPSHIANGMYGLILVEPEGGLPPVDEEYYVMQNEYYATDNADKKTLEYDYGSGLDENPKLVVFNGKEGALTEAPLVLPQGKRARIYFGNAGPNLISSFHIIGMIFDKVYREGDVVSTPASAIQTTLVPAGGACAVDVEGVVPGNYTLVDHSIFRLDKGAVGFLKVVGKEQRLDLYQAEGMPQNCAGCKLHN